MFVTTTPFINLANANAAAFARFLESWDITQYRPAVADAEAETTAAANGEADSAQRAFPGFSRMEAVAEWTRTVLDNYSQFANEFVRTFFGPIANGQFLLAAPALNAAAALGTAEESADLVEPGASAPASELADAAEKSMAAISEDSGALGQNTEEVSEYTDPVGEDSGETVDEDAEAAESEGGATTPAAKPRQRRKASAA